MSDQLLALGVIGVRLYDCILTAQATAPEELSDHIVDTINGYLIRATPKEKTLLFHLACEIHDALSKNFDRVDNLEARKDVIKLVNVLINRARAFAGHHGD
ncbi:hypothetical protein SAMN05660284_01919 [Formivibrio citricus]|uniref:Uncharacterized protein n=1 Tax=Formivibrio citricus TaxID=83765 RepID=A0A1I5AI20_9NEIS|nr:hypothetical protein [Formivibrio citricus]SFN62068.1 hypothetical protein SAMN05660284_01919 [Formivibrio citricus]